jgi:hypothetical protein
MMITYKLVNDLSGNPRNVVRSDGWCIPFDPANTDYQEYLKFLAEGGQPLPADDNGQTPE